MVSVVGCAASGVVGVVSAVLTEVLVTKGERFYQIDMYSDSPLTPEQLLQFDQMLASLQLDG